MDSLLAIAKYENTVLNTKVIQSLGTTENGYWTLFPLELSSWRMKLTVLCSSGEVKNARSCDSAPSTSSHLLLNDQLIYITIQCDMLHQTENTLILLSLTTK